MSQACLVNKTPPVILSIFYDCLEYTELKLYDGAGEYSSQLCVKAGLQGQVIDSPQGHIDSQTAVHTPYLTKGKFSISLTCKLLTEGSQAKKSNCFLHLFIGW